MKREKIWDCRKTDGQSEAFESRKWKTKAIWKVRAKGWGLRGLRTGVGDRICGRGESATSVTDSEVTLFTARLICLSVWWGGSKTMVKKQVCASVRGELCKEQTYGKNKNKWSFLKSDRSSTGKDSRL